MSHDGHAVAWRRRPSGPLARSVAIAALAACLMVSAPAWANEATNGSFESPDIPTGTSANFASILGWTPTNSCGIEVQDHVAGAPYEGNQFVELNSHCRSGIKETLNPAFPDVPYSVSYAFSPRPGTKADDNKLNVYWNGTLVDTAGPQAGASNTTWSQRFVEVDPVPGQPNTLKFVSAGTNPSGGTVGVDLDDVQVIPLEIICVDAYICGGGGG